MKLPRLLCVNRLPANFERTNKDIDKLKNCRRLKNRQDFLVQYMVLFVAPNRVQLGLAVANKSGELFFALRLSPLLLYYSLTGASTTVVPMLRISD